MEKGKDYIGIGCWGIVTNEQGKILLLKRLDKDYWERPGGKVEVGETLEDSIIREVFEETGIEAKIKDFVLFEQILSNVNNQHWIAFCYHLEYESGELENKEPEKHMAVQWFALNEVPEEISPYTKRAINEFKIKKK
jgi:8-oxo-dGTP diphosphatase